MCLNRLEAEFASRFEVRQLLEYRLLPRDVVRTDVLFEWGVQRNLVGVPLTSRFGEKMGMERLEAEKLDEREKDTAKKVKMTKDSQKIRNWMK
ncbi:hypothetical protein BTUL_0118g00400 [Botrytis tulipae]|uniref:Uncharacterized protein n=1 Tax=Botrytis tulipae TaxID=87230 RepID=A0A4Z1EJS6_9HELO|nr:hypothetical protein BTUL_0118g00400 [Botrytis tulipae]